jgi:mRNA interferase MazF
MCQITSNPYGDPIAIALNARDFSFGSLLIASFARPGKLFTASESLVIRCVAKLSEPSFERILDAVVTLLRPEDAI